MITVRCKFVCSNVEDLGGKFKANFLAVYSGSPENEKFFHLTPSASMELQVINEQHFEKGKEYFIDITEAV